MTPALLVASACHRGYAERNAVIGEVVGCPIPGSGPTSTRIA